MPFADVLAGLTTGVLTVPTVSYILKLKYLQKYLTTKNAKRWTAIGLSFALGIGAFFAMTRLGLRPTPIGPAAWLDALWPVCTAAYTASQAVLSLYKTDAIQNWLPGNGKKPEAEKEPDGRAD